MTKCCAVIQELFGQQVIIERVPNPQGVLLTFHGCSHSALDWWRKQPSCQDCLGAALSHAALSHAVCTLTISTPRNAVCIAGVSVLPSLT